MGDGGAAGGTEPVSRSVFARVCVRAEAAGRPSERGVGG